MHTHNQQITQLQTKPSIVLNIKIIITDTVKTTTTLAAFMKIAHRANGNVLRIKGVFGPELGSKSM